jgi:hypothetical protein
MLIFDFYAGTGSSTQAFADAGHRVIRFENDPQFDAERYDDISTLKAADLVEQYGRPDFVWASPPCTSFSVASIGRHWHAPGIPKTQQASDAQDLVGYTVDLIRDLDPRFGWLMENPRGMLRKLPVVADLERRTITYCAYGDFRMKPTDYGGGGRVVTSTGLQERRPVSRVSASRFQDWDSGNGNTRGQSNGALRTGCRTVSGNH